MKRVGQHHTGAGSHCGSKRTGIAVDQLKCLERHDATHNALNADRCSGGAIQAQALCVGGFTVYRFC